MLVNFSEILLILYCVMVTIFGVWIQEVPIILNITIIIIRGRETS